jgi:hypothetical protein
VKLTVEQRERVIAFLSKNNLNVLRKATDEECMAALVEGENLKAEILTEERQKIWESET